MTENTENTAKKADTEEENAVQTEAPETEEQAEKDTSAETPEEGTAEAVNTPEAAEEKPDEVAVLTEKAAALEKQLADEKERYLRLDAEYYNFRQRSVKEKSEAYESASADAAKEILSVIDNFERASQAECSDENFKKGIDMIFKQYLGVLDKLGIKEIEAEGKTFDPNFHNAVQSTENEELGENTVAQVLQKGYVTGSGKVLRPAMVIVANP